MPEQLELVETSWDLRVDGRTYVRIERYDPRDGTPPDFTVTAGDDHIATYTVWDEAVEAAQRVVAAAHRRAMARIEAEDRYYTEVENATGIKHRI